MVILVIHLNMTVTKYLSYFCFIVLIEFSYSKSLLPESFQRCKVTSENQMNECLTSAMNEALPLLADENKDLGTYAFDPLRVKEIIIDRDGTDRPVSILMKFTESDIFGLSRTKVYNVTGTLSNPKTFEMRFSFTTENVTLKGLYYVNGKILLLPLSGDGLSTMSMYNMSGTVIIKGLKQVKKDDEYLKISEFLLDFDATGFHMYLTNLFNGNKLLGENMNKLLNENWHNNFEELRPSIVGAFGAVLEDYAKRILERVPFKNIFLLD